MAEQNSATTVVDDDKQVTEEDLRNLKYPDEEVETAEAEDETSEETETNEESEETSEDGDQIDESTEDEEQSEDENSETPSFVKKFDYIKGDTPEEYAKNLEAAYENSSVEGRRINAELQELKKAPPVTQTETQEDDTTTTVKSPTDLYIQQKLDEEIQTAFAVTQKEYPQVNDQAEYAKFTKEVATFSRTILDTQGRLATPTELYNKAAISLGWEKKVVEPDDKEKLAMATKNGAAASKTSTGPAKPKSSGPKVSEAMLKMNRKFYPGKTDQEIIDELTPYL